MNSDSLHHATSKKVHSRVLFCHKQLFIQIKCSYFCLRHFSYFPSHQQVQLISIKMQGASDLPSFGGCLSLLAMDARAKFQSRSVTVSSVGFVCLSVSGSFVTSFRYFLLWHLGPMGVPIGTCYRDESRVATESDACAAAAAAIAAAAEATTPSCNHGRGRQQTSTCATKTHAR